MAAGLRPRRLFLAARRRGQGAGTQERESPYILGKIQENVEEAGPIRLFGPGSALGLDQGRVELEGTVYLNGQTLEAYIQKIVAEMLG